MAENKNKFVKFGLGANTNVGTNANSYTDDALILGGTVGGINLGQVVDAGIPYGTIARTAILNAILRQTTVMAHTLAELIKSNNDITVDSETEDLVGELELSIAKLAQQVITSNTAESYNTITALNPSETRLVTEKRMANAIVDNLEVESDKLSLSANQGVVINGRLVALENADYQNSTQVRDAIKVRVSNDASTPPILTLWVGTQAQYDLLSDKTGLLCMIVD